MAEHETPRDGEPEERIAKPMNVTNNSTTGQTITLVWGVNTWPLGAGAKRTNIDVSQNDIVISGTPPPSTPLPITIENTSNGTSYPVEANQGTTQTKLTVGTAYPFDVSEGAVTLVDSEPVVSGS